VKLLFDENLSHKLVAVLGDVFPKSAHVRDIGLARGEDDAIWTAAKDGGYVIVSKDDDFHQRSFLFGAPPKVIWVRLGNCPTVTIAGCIRLHVSEIIAFINDENATFMVIT
jgi:predicted nuclease of predicted toxin-antitoxin system